MKEHLKEIFDYQDMVNSLVRRDLRGKYKGSVMGFLWTFINPLCQMIVYMVVFSVIIRSELEQFYVYMITGMVPWLFFDMALRQGACCALSGRAGEENIFSKRSPAACVRDIELYEYAVLFSDRVYGADHLGCWRASGGPCLAAACDGD